MTEDSHKAEGDMWHLDKRVPIVLVLTILIQGAMWVWWLSGVDNSVRTLRNEVSSLKASQAVAFSKLEALIRLEVQVGALAKQLDKMDVEYRASIRRLWTETRKKVNRTVGWKDQNPDGR